MAWSLDPHPDLVITAGQGDIAVRINGVTFLLIEQATGKLRRVPSGANPATSAAQYGVVVDSSGIIAEV